MYTTLTRIFNADHEPLSLADMKTHLRITDDDNNEFLRSIIAAAREHVESHIQKTLITTTWEAKYQEFETVFELPKSPIQNIDSFTYLNTSSFSTAITSNDYEFDASGRLRAREHFEWPEHFDKLEPITIRYTAGWLDAGQLPDDIKQALKLLIGSWDINRENETFTPTNEIPFGVKALLNPYRIHQM